jgi:hypothetical protein
MDGVLILCCSFFVDFYSLLGDTMRTCRSGALGTRKAGEEEKSYLKNCRTPKHCRSDSKLKLETIVSTFACVFTHLALDKRIFVGTIAALKSNRGVSFLVPDGSLFGKRRTEIRPDVQSVRP